MKNILFKLFVCMLLVGTCFTVTMVSAEDLVEGDYTYTISNGEATLKKYTGTGETVTIPATLGGYQTVAIGDYAFFQKSSMISVIIPNSVTTIGFRAFDSCTSLTSVTIPNSVTTIKDEVFIHCNVMTSFTIPSSVTTIGKGAFSNCDSLATVNIPSSITIIPDQGFASNYKLTTITIPDTVTHIGVQAFGYCRALTTINIPNSVTVIEDYAFQGCTSLTTMTIGNGVTAIGPPSSGNTGGYAFTGCTSLKSVTIGSSVTTIGVLTFYGCSSLTSITFLGLVAPTTVGEQWIENIPTEIRGHAYSNSNFPAPGEVWNGLTMGAYIGAENKPPIAVFTWTPSNPTINQGIAFNASTSNDPDGSITKYEWDFNNDGTFEESHATPTAAYSWTQAGSYPVILRVTDNDGATSTKTMTVTVSSEDQTPGTTEPKTPGFELIFVLCAIALILLWRRKRKL